MSARQWQEVQAVLRQRGAAPLSWDRGPHRRLPPHHHASKLSRMGVHVNLSAERNHIGLDAWAVYFDEALVTRRAYSPGALSLDMLEVAGVEVPAYANEVLHGRGGVPCIRIVGDRASKRGGGESRCRSLDLERKRVRKRRVSLERALLVL